MRHLLSLGHDEITPRRIKNIIDFIIKNDLSLKIMILQIIDNIIISCYKKLIKKINLF